MVERLLMRMCGTLSRVSHIGFVEAFDISRAPEGLWGGLPFFGFGRDPRELGADWVVAKAGDFYYGDVIGNAAHALYGAMPDDVRVERSLRGIPAVKDIRVGSILIAAGTTAALHMTHRGYLGQHNFFTNEEIWFLGAENAYYGEDVPFGGLPAHGGYTFKISGEPANIQGQISWPKLHPSMDHPITTVSVNALLDAVGPVCRAQPGIIIDDARPYYRYDDGTPLRKARRHHRPPHRVIIWGPADLRNAVIEAAQADANIAVIPVASRSNLLTAEADCIVFFKDPITPSNEIDAMVLSLLERGKNVLSIAADNLPTPSLREACRRGGTSIHRFEFHTTVMIERIVMTMVQGLRSGAPHSDRRGPRPVNDSRETERRHGARVRAGYCQAGCQFISDPHLQSHSRDRDSRTRLVRGRCDQCSDSAHSSLAISGTHFFDRGTRDRERHGGGALHSPPWIHR